MLQRTARVRAGRRFDRFAVYRMRDTLIRGSRVGLFVAGFVFVVSYVLVAVYGGLARKLLQSMHLPQLSPLAVSARASLVLLVVLEALTIVLAVRSLFVAPGVRTVDGRPVEVQLFTRASTAAPVDEDGQ